MKICHNHLKIWVEPTCEMSVYHTYLRQRTMSSIILAQWIDLQRTITYCSQDQHSFSIVCTSLFHLILDSSSKMLSDKFISFTSHYISMIIKKQCQYTAMMESERRALSTNSMNALLVFVVWQISKQYSNQ